MGQNHLGMRFRFLPLLRRPAPLYVTLIIPEVWGKYSSFFQHNPDVKGLTLLGEKGTTEVRRQEEWEAYLFLKHRPAKPSGVEKTSHYFTNSHNAHVQRFRI